MSSEIHLGFEVGTGAPVRVPVRHLAVVGQTQLSGKTTTLEALISRSGLRAVAFITKRAEASFTEGRRIPPYFRERADWQFVAAILEATLRERLKIHRSAIMKMSRGAHTLADVHRNVLRELPKARGFYESILTELHHYLEIVIPQIARLPYVKEIRIEPGLNIMDLVDYTLELQSLVIRSALEWVSERESDTVVIIPEAWEMIPQQRGSPVKLAAEQLIRKGGAAENFVWLDSQDIASVHTDVRRSIGVWIFGVQAEHNEVQRTLAHIPGARQKLKPEDIMELGRGEFFVRFDKELRKVYIQPAWLDEESARLVALGKLPLESVAYAQPLAAFQKAAGQAGISVRRPVEIAAPSRDREGAVSERNEEDEVWKEKYQEAEKRRGRLEEHCRDLAAQIQEQQTRIEELQKREDERRAERLSAIQKKAARDKAASQSPTAVQPSIAETVVNAEQLYQYVRRRLEQEPAVLALAAQRPELLVKVERRTVEIDDSTYKGKVARLVADGRLDEESTQDSVFKELVRRGLSIKTPKIRIWEALMALTEMGILLKEPDGWIKARGVVVRQESITAAAAR